MTMINLLIACRGAYNNPRSAAPCHVLVVNAMPVYSS